jgi:hypothetical protein
MIRTLVVGFLLFVAFAVAFAPATLVRTLLPADGGVEILEPSGTLWNGSARLFLAGQPAGRVAWQLRPVTILQGALGYHLRVTGPEHELAGNVRLGLGAGGGSLDGRLSSAFANRWLAPYDIAISGGLILQGISVRVPYDLAGGEGGRASGSVTWSGGPVQYRLSGRNYRQGLPPMVAYLGDGLEAVVYPEGGQTPLLRADLRPNGFVRIGVTQLLTRLAGNPWPGSHADHEVVLEVEEQLF